MSSLSTSSARKLLQSKNKPFVLSLLKHVKTEHLLIAILNRYDVIHFKNLIECLEINEEMKNNLNDQENKIVFENNFVKNGLV